VLSLRLRIALALLVGLASCDGNTVGSGRAGRETRAVYCTVMAEPVNRETVGKEGTGEHIVASVHFRCDKPGPDTLTLTVALQQKVNGQWVTLVSREFTAGGADTTRARSEADRVRSVVAPCAPGVYRTDVTGTGTSHGKTTPYTMHGMSITNPCRRLG
jgi:hypothetical protein